MIKNIYDNEVGYMVGTFYADVFGYEMEVWFEKDIPQKYLEKNIEYLNILDHEFLISICAALKRFYEAYKNMYPDLCEFVEGDVLEDYEKDPLSIFKYVKIGVYKFHKCSVNDEDIPVLNLCGDCAWSGDKGVTIAVKNNQLLYVGPWQDRNVWDNRVESSLERRFNYAIPKDT